MSVCDNTHLSSLSVTDGCSAVYVTSRLPGAHTTPFEANQDFCPAHATTFQSTNNRRGGIDGTLAKTTWTNLAARFRSSGVGNRRGNPTKCNRGYRHCRNGKYHVARVLLHARDAGRVCGSRTLYLCPCAARSSASPFGIVQALLVISGRPYPTLSRAFRTLVSKKIIASPDRHHLKVLDQDSFNRLVHPRSGKK